MHVIESDPVVLRAKDSVEQLQQVPYAYLMGALDDKQSSPRGVRSPATVQCQYANGGPLLHYGPGPLASRTPTSDLRALCLICQRRRVRLSSSRLHLPITFR